MQSTDDIDKLFTAFGPSEDFCAEKVNDIPSDVQQISIQQWVYDMYHETSCAEICFLVECGRDCFSGAEVKCCCISVRLCFVIVPSKYSCWR